MSPKTTQFYEFANFRLDPAQKILLRDGEPLALTPKVFDTLEILIENAGLLVEKDELMRAIWRDHFVEESNLTSNIKTLRKALGDSAAAPRFIETVPRRGYRFIAEVKRNKLTPEIKSAPGEQNLAPNRRNFLFALMILLIAAIGIGSWYAQSKPGAANAPILAAPYALENISTNGKAVSAAVSPDGKWAVYAVVNDDKQSVWLRRLDTSENVEIIPPMDARYRVFEFSPDGNYLYFSRRLLAADAPTDVYRLPVSGGIPTKIIGNIWFHFSLSPDGQKISFHRCCQNEDEDYSLWIADSGDGKNERKILSTQSPQRIGDNQISPDGKQIAFAVGQSENEGNDFHLKTVDIESGATRDLTDEKFFDIRYLRWLPDQSGLLLTAAAIPNKYFRIWQINAATGEAQPLTKDSDNYRVLSLDASGSRLISTQTKEDFRLQVRSLDNPSANKILTNAAGASFAPDGKIVFCSSMTGNDEIWSIKADGSAQRQLTNDPADDRYPIASPADNSIFFTSNRTGEAHVWRMNADGSDQRQLTQKQGGFPLLASPDGRWVYFHHAVDRTLWRVSTGGAGDEEPVLNKKQDNNRFDISPDGSRIAFAESQDGENFLKIISLPGGQAIERRSIAEPRRRVMKIAWLPDGKTLAYVQADAEGRNYALWLQAPGAAAAQKIADLGNEEIFSLEFAPDGRSFLVAQGGWRHDAVLLKGLK